MGIWKSHADIILLIYVHYMVYICKLYSVYVYFILYICIITPILSTLLGCYQNDLKCFNDILKYFPT